MHKTNLFMGLLMITVSLGFIIGASDFDVGKLTMACGFSSSALLLGFGLYELFWSDKKWTS